MKSNTFALWLLMLTFLLSQTYGFFERHFGGKEDLRGKVASLRDEVERQKLKAALAHYELESFRNQVAALIPSAESLKKTYQGRTLASIIQAPDSEKIQVESAESLFAQGKEFFKQQYYEKSSAIFKKITENHPNSLRVIESYFLLAEGLYHLREYDGCIRAIDAMVDLFPEHELTGFAMLRTGAILQERERLEDAVEVYATVRDSFNDPTLKSQANHLLKEVEL